MSVATFKTNTPFLKRAVVAVAATVACAGAWADLPDFTLSPTGAGLTGSSITADNLLISDFATVTLAGNSFSETGTLYVTGAQLNGTQITGAGLGGLGTTYGLYFQYSGTGTLAASGNPATTFTYGNFDTLNFTLYGYNGTSPSAQFELGKGSLLNGTVSTAPDGSGGFSPGANVKVSFAAGADAGSFYTSPSPFYNLALSSFVNTPSQVTQTATGFTITAGGGTVNFATAVPEPETYAMIFAGLGALGFLARRRSGGNNS